MDDTPKLLGDRIRLRREELGLTPVHLADYAKVSISAVLQWESGKSKNLKIDNLFAIADALGLEPRWLGTGEGPKDLPRTRVPLFRGGEKKVPQQNRKTSKTKGGK